MSRVKVPLRWLPVVATVAAFGPYLVAGVRTEQVVVYGGVVLLLSLRWRQVVTLPRPALGFVAAWVGIVGFSLVRLVFPDPSPVPRGSLLAGADNLLLPLAAFLIGALLASAVALRRVAAVVAVGMAVNAVVAVGQFLTPAVVTASRYWWTTSSGEVVGDRAVVNMGRYPGLLNQPALAGVAYGVGLLCAIYVYRRRPSWLWPTVALCLVGGVLVVSKAFLLIGLPVAAYQLVMSAETRRGRLLTVAAGVGGAAVVVVGARASGWRGFDRLVQSVPLLSGGGMRDLTGGRYGNGNDEVAAIVGPVIDEHLWFGLGLRGIGQSTDSAWFQMLTFGGVFAVTLYAAALGFLAWAWWRNRDRLLGGLLLIVAGASLGFPALTANRLAVWLGLLLGMLAVATSANPSQRQVRTRQHLRV